MDSNTLIAVMSLGFGVLGSLLWSVKIISDRKYSGGVSKEEFNKLSSKVKSNKNGLTHLLSDIGSKLMDIDLSIKSIQDEQKEFYKTITDHRGKSDTFKGIINEKMDNIDDKFKRVDRDIGLVKEIKNLKK